MAYYSIEQLKMLGFKKLGSNVKISTLSSIYDHHLIEIGNNVRVDDFCVISGKIKIGDYCHITVGCMLAGGLPGIMIDNFSTLAYGVKVFTQSDDYSGESMVNSLIPKEYKKEIMKPIHIFKQVIVGSGSIIFPGVNLNEGVAIGALSLVLKDCDAWHIYYGIPAIKKAKRDKNILLLEDKFLKNENK
jgi:acetyltransferase-like isoleucine patch superfamily enzyme